MKIRRAVKADALNIATIGSCVWVDTYSTEGVSDNISDYIAEEFTQIKIEKLIEKKTVYIAKNESHTTGYMVLSQTKNSKIEIENLYILPRFQHNKIGSMLIQEAISSYSGLLWLSVWEENINAINFYRKHGFQQQGELFFKLKKHKIRNLIFEKIL